jgi:hypothetical protein
MKITSKVANPTLESVTITLTPREAYVLCRTFGSLTQNIIMDAIKKGEMEGGSAHKVYSTILPSIPRHHIRDDEIYNQTSVLFNNLHQQLENPLKMGGE